MAQPQSNTIDETAARLFQEWINSSSDIQSDQVELRYLGPEQGFGVFARRNIRRDETVIRVPKHLLITASMVASLPEYAFLLSSVQLEPFEVLVLFFSLEKLILQEMDASNRVITNFVQLRSQSTNTLHSWLPLYLNVLPKQFGTLLASNFGPDVAKELPLVARQLYFKQVEEYERMCTKLSLALKGWQDLDLFKWAWHIVNTRCIFVDSPAVNIAHMLVDSSKSGDTIAVIPLVDMLNHHPEAHCVARFDSHSQTYCVLTANRSVMEGQQLYVCYGPHDNAKLWLEYGFDLGSDNVFNRVNIPTDLFIALAKQTNLVDVDEPHQNVLKQASFPCTIYATDQEPNYGLKTNCAILLLNQKDLKDWRQHIYQPSNEDQADAVEPLLSAILTQLAAHLKSRADKVENEKCRSFWTDQLVILERLLQPSQD